MFFVTSKIFWMFASPVILLLIVAFLGVLSSRGRHARTGRAVALGAITLLAAAAVTPLGVVLVAPLEDRFPLPPTDMPLPDGIIVLGSAVNGAISRARGQTVFDEGERAAQAALLAKRYPDARVVYSGGSGSLISRDSIEAVEARKFLADLGVDPARVTLEDKSRNTDENARFTERLVRPEPQQRWLLVTSAYHMPRSMGLFEKAGFNVTAYPVAFRTVGRGHGLQWDPDPARNLRIIEIAAKEWIGLVAYWATGRIDRLFPGPGDAGPEASAYSAEGAPRR